LSVDELYLKGRKFDRATDRRQARAYYERAVTRDPGHVDALRALAVLDFEAGLYDEAIQRCGQALDRDSDAGWCWYYRGVSHLRLGQFADALRCGYRAARCLGTASIGYDLAGRAAMRLNDRRGARNAFAQAVRADGTDVRAADHLILTQYTDGATEAKQAARGRIRDNPTAVVPLALTWLCDGGTAADLDRSLRSFLGEPEFELLEASLVFAELGLFDEARRLVQAGCVEAAPDRSCLPFYYLAWYASQCDDLEAAQKWLVQASQTRKERVFASRPEEVEMLRFAAAQNPRDPQAQLQLGCLLAHLGRVDEATAAWQKAVELDPRQSIPWRNLGLAAAARDDLTGAEANYRRAIAARPGDQTLYRDLAEILIAADRRSDAARLLEDMPIAGMRRADITVMLAEAYVALERYEDCLRLLTATPYFVNWEGQDITWRLFNRSHIERGRKRLEQEGAAAALTDFEAALTYPANLNVGRSNRPLEAPAQYWRGRALTALGRTQEAHQAWQTGAAGADMPGEQNEYREKCRQALAGG